MKGCIDRVQSMEQFIFKSEGMFWAEVMNESHGIRIDDCEILGVVLECRANVEAFCSTKTL